MLINGRTIFRTVKNGQTKHHKIIFIFFQHLDHSYFNMTVNNDTSLQTIVKVERPLAAIKFKLNGVNRQNKGFSLNFFKYLLHRPKRSDVKVKFMAPRTIADVDFFKILRTESRPGKN